MSSARVVLVLAMTLTLAACTPVALDAEPPNVSPTAPTDAAPAAPSWTPDSTIEREFTDADGTKTCTILTRIPDAPQSANDTLVNAVAAAKEFLSQGDWDAVEVSLDQFDPAELAARREQGVSDPELLTTLLQNRIHDDMDAAGLLIPELSVESQVACV